jgi:hypothetical protein
MGQGGFRLLFAMAIGLAVLALTGTAGAAQSSCATRLIADWRDGRIDGTYPVSCYRVALADLPEDVRVYSTAQSDIRRALQTRLSEVAASSGDNGGGGGGGVSPLLVVAITGGILLAAGSVAAAVR